MQDDFKAKVEAEFNRMIESKLATPDTQEARTTSRRKPECTETTR